MGDNSTIEWTDATWNPVTGCSKVSPGCAHCYAETLTRRFSKKWGVPDLPWTPQNARENVILHAERLDQPLRWKRPRMVFVNSMSDLFHELVSDRFIGEVFGVMAASPHHTFQVLTKRPARMRDLVRSLPDRGAQAMGVSEFTERMSTPFAEALFSRTWTGVWPLSNVWLGTSIENRRYVDRADLLRETPAAIRFVSAEPLLGPLVRCNEVSYGGAEWEDDYIGPELDLWNIDWLIVGGESGPGHRPIKHAWVDELRWAAHRSHTAFFFKQWGGVTPKARGKMLYGREFQEMPSRERAVA